MPSLSILIARPLREMRTLPGASSALRGTPVSVEQLALVRVVRAAAELDILYRGLAPDPVRVDVMKLDESPLVAPSPALAHESAGTAVTEPDRTLDLGRDIPTTGSRAATGPRPLRLRELFPGQLFQQRRQRPIDDLRQVSRGDGVSEQVLGQA